MSIFHLRRAQTSVEFTVLIVFMFFIAMVFFVVITQRSLETQEQNDKTLLENVKIMVENEIDVALQMQDGYSRSFVLPNKLNMFDYKVVNSETEIVFKYVNSSVKHEIVLLLKDNITANVSKGSNLIEMENGVIFINKNT